MPQYLIALYPSVNDDPRVDTEAMMEDIHALNREMIAAGVRRFAGGLDPAATTLRSQPDGDVLVTDGPYLESKELVGGLWILETADRDEALAWARKGAKACRAAVELREIFFVPAPEKG
nr:YciI family protein [Dyella sp. 2HG41-7]